MILLKFDGLAPLVDLHTNGKNDASIDIADKKQLQREIPMV